MKVLVACEKSQTVCKAFRERGHEAYSCDIQEESGGHSEWHIMTDVIPLLNGNCTFTTRGGQTVTIDGKWDLIIAHPPCTFLSNVSTRNFSLKCTAAEKVVHRWEERAKACVFFMLCALADCDRIAVENPVGFISKAYRKPDQIIHPYMFSSDPTGEEYVTKRTCLWLKGLPSLKRTNNFPKPNNAEIFGVNPSGKTKTWEDSFSFCGKRQEKRSKTFPGIAKAMAEQWGCLHEGI